MGLMEARQLWKAVEVKHCWLRPCRLWMFTRCIRYQWGVTGDMIVFFYDTGKLGKYTATVQTHSVMGLYNSMIFPSQLSLGWCFQLSTKYIIHHFRHIQVLPDVIFFSFAILKIKNITKIISVENIFTILS